MCNKGRTADHQEQKICEANIGYIQAIPSGSVGQTLWQTL